MTRTMDCSSTEQTSQARILSSRDFQPSGHSGESEDGNSHPAKRQRVLACKRCRHRKQKCDGDGEAPCSNCRRASEECEPTEPALGRARYSTEYVRSLEQRLAQAERLNPQNVETTAIDNDNTGIEQKLKDLSENSVLQNGLTDVFNAVIHGAGSPYTWDVFRGYEEIPRFDDVTAHPHPASHSSPARTHQSHSSHVSAAMNLRSPGNRHASLEASSKSLTVPDSTTRNLMATLPSALSLQHSNPEDSAAPPSVERYMNQLAVWPDAIPPSVEDHLIHLYFDNANSRFPFLLRHIFNIWHATWKQRSSDPIHAEIWEGFFVNMIFAVGLLLDPKNPISVAHTSQNFYDQAVNRYLPLVLRQPSRLLHVQAYLMMSLHAIFSPSTEQIVLMISSTMRHCVLAQFHLAEAEPEPIDDETRIEIQMRRRAFWVAYGLDRLACGVLRIPLSIPDDNITVPLFDNIDDSELLRGSSVILGPSSFTSVSAALHQERCRTIQSEILSVTMRSDFPANFDSLFDWRSNILSKLERWRSQLQDAADKNSKRPTDWRWILIVYNHCLLFLHIPTKLNVRGPAGDWSLRASIQTIMIFRKFQSYKTIPHPWLGLISQFSAGITILYCIWCTPPKFRSDAYNSKRVLEAIRACSNNILIMADRWERAKDLLDVYEVLATEIPLAETPDGDGTRAINRISGDAADEVRDKLKNVNSMVLNREIIRMIREMITENLPVAGDDLTNREFVSLGDKINFDPAFLNNNSNTPTYQFPNLCFSSNSEYSEIGTLLMGQNLEYPDTLPDYDVY